MGFLAIARPVAVGLALSPGIAAASPGPAVIATPRGWTVDAEPRARARVTSWLDHDARALVVLSPGTIDDFAEALAVIELQGAFDLEVPRADELRRALPARLGTLDDATVEIDPIEGAPASVRGRGKGGGHVFEAVLVPSGSTRKLVVLEVREGEESLYRGTMDAALAGLTGIAEPLRPFAVAAWRWTAILGWLVVTAGALAVGLVRRPFGADARTIGRVLALGCLVAAVITAALVWTPLHDRTEAMHLVGITPGTLALEIAGYGLVAAIVCWLVGAIAGRGEAGWVQSAPRTGVFADKSLSMPRVPIVPGPGARLAHPDGDGNLEDQPHSDVP